MAKIEKNVYIAAPIGKVWAALTDREAIESWMGEDSVAEVTLKEGGSYRVFGGESLALTLARTALAFALVAPSAIAMGGTLPALAASVARGARANERLGLVYGLNTLGAALGGFAAGFFLVIELGVRGTWIFAAAGDVLLGILVWLLAAKA